MKKRILLLALIFFGAVCFSSLNNNGLSACDKNCPNTCFSATKPAIKIIDAGYEDDEYSKTGPQFPFVTL